MVRNIKKKQNVKRARKIALLKQKFQPKKYIPLLLILIFLLLVSFAILEVFSRSTNNPRKITQKEYVLGLEKIPTYPSSQFLYINTLEDSSVKEMLSSGKSAYKILDRSTFENVKEFYANELNSLGWELVLDVSIGTEEKKYGQYWVKEERGLRIYDKHGDIWYEYITPEEAQSGLSNRVAYEIEIAMLLEGSDYQDLLPDYPWQVKIPKEYLIRYEVSEFNDLRAVSFQRISTAKIISIYPIGYWGAKQLDSFLQDYVEILTNKTPNESEWGIQNTVVSTFQGSNSIVGSISNQSDQRSVMVIKNSKNSVAYVLSAQDETDPLYEYLQKNLRYLGQEDS